MDHRTTHQTLMIKGLLEDEKRPSCLRIKSFQMESSTILQHTLEIIFKILFKRMRFTVLKDSLKWTVVFLMQTLAMVLII
jgi:hypothetical protein